jgi:hypothetical protein
MYNNGDNYQIGLQETMSSVGSKRKIDGGDTPAVLKPATASSVTDALPKRRFQRRNSKVGKMFFDDSNSFRPEILHSDEFQKSQRRYSPSGVTISTSLDKYGILSIPEEQVMKDATVVIIVQSAVHSKAETSLNDFP